MSAGAPPGSTSPTTSAALDHREPGLGARHRLRTGTLEPGKHADVVVWSGSPFSVYARAELVIGGGDVVFDRAAGSTATDYELGNSARERPMVTR